MARARTQAVMLAAMLVAGGVRAQPQPQQAAVPTDARPAPADSWQAGQPRSGQDVTTLGEVRALKPEEDVPLDLYRFRNPMEVPPNHFDRSWREPPSLEQVGMSGGYVMMGINYAIGAAAKGLHKLTRAPDQIQPAIARPPPQFDADQQRRAAGFCEQQEGC